MIYEDVRSKLGNGDLVFFQSQSIRGWSIRAFSSLIEKKAPVFDHVGIVRLEYDRVKLFEAVWPMSREVMLSNRLKNFKGAVTFCRVVTGKPTEEDTFMRSQAVRFAVSMSGVEYERILHLTTAFIAGKLKLIADNQRYYCSEYVSLVWSTAGLNLCPSNEVSPSSLYQSPYLRPVGRLE